MKATGWVKKLATLFDSLIFYSSSTEIKKWGHFWITHQVFCLKVYKIKINGLNLGDICGFKNKVFYAELIEK